MKPTFLLLIFSFYFACTFSQNRTLKTEVIDYKDGKVSYQCYEDSKTSELIKHGEFKYIVNQKSAQGSYLLTVTGFFKDGYRDGLWSFSIKQIDFPNLNGTFTTGILISTQSYKNGVPNGAWRVDETRKTRELYYQHGRYVWGAYSNIYKEFFSTIFRDGIATGITTYQIDGKGNTLNLNNEGFLTGNIIADGIGTRLELSFNNKGVITKHVERQVSTGKVVYKSDFDPELLQIGDKYLSGAITREQLSEMNINVDTISRISFLNDYENIFMHNYFNLEGIDGDKTMIDNNDKRIYGRFIKFQRVERVRYNEHRAWKSDFLSQKDAIDFYEDFLLRYSKEIKIEDIEKVEEIINKKKLYLKNEQIEKESYDRYLKLTDKKSEQLRQVAMSQSDYIIALNKGDDCFNVKSLLSELFKKEYKLRQEVSEKPNASSNSILRYTDKLKEFLPIYDKFDKEYFPFVNSFDSVLNNAVKVKGLINSILKTKNCSQNSDLTDIQSEYSNLINQMIGEGNGISDIKTIGKLFDNLLLVSLKISTLEGKESRILAKQLRKCKSIEEKKKIFEL